MGKFSPDRSVLPIPDRSFGGTMGRDGNRMLNQTYSLLGVETYRQGVHGADPPGDVTVKMLFTADEAKPGTGGTVSLWANGKLVGEGKMAHTVPVAFSSYAGMDIGRDNGLVVDLDPCPCGSGRKWKHCHQRTPTKADPVFRPSRHV